LVYEFEYRIIYVDMPCSIKAYMSEIDGFYNIFVNSRLNCEQNEFSIRHELEHIQQKDFYKEEPVDSIEKARHSKRLVFANCI